MSDDLIYFRQKVAKDGYQIDTPVKLFSKTGSFPFPTKEQQQVDAGKIKPEPSIVLKTIDGLYRIYSPIEEEQALFRLFAELPRNDNAILTFANQYGLMGRDQHVKVKHIDNFQIGAEPLRWWREEIIKMKEMVSLWDAITSHNTTELSARIEWHQSDKSISVRYLYKKRIETILMYIQGHLIGDPGDKYLLDQINFGNTILPAKIMLQKTINKYLSTYLSPSLIFDQSLSGQTINIIPKNLLGAMWLQLAQTIEGNIKYRRCAECQKPFRVESSERGVKRVFCSDACKSRDYRKRKNAQKRKKSSRA